MMRFLFYTLALWINFQAQGQEKSDSVKLVITNVGETINTPYDEYAPVISADGLMMIFTSRRPVFKEDITKKMQGMENVYVSYYNDMTWKWSGAKMMSETLNQLGRNNSAIALSNDGQRMLLYRGDPDGNIYESVLNGEEWSEPVKLPDPINSNKHESTASISPDGRTIYFVSNRKGGQGELDIWLCHQDSKGNWGKAENLGSSVNTSQDEEGVFIHPDGKTLYFSSKGHNTIGGFDIFKSVFENVNWSKPLSLGNLINTTEDDLFFTLTADGKTGYYSTSHEGNNSVKTVKTLSLVELIQKAQVQMEQQVQQIQQAKLLLPDQSEQEVRKVIQDSQIQLAKLAEQVQQVIKAAQAQLILKEILVRNTGTSGSKSDAGSADSIGSKGHIIETESGVFAKTNSHKGDKGNRGSDQTGSAGDKGNSGSLSSMASTVIRASIGMKDIYELYFKNTKNESRLTLFKGHVIDFETQKPIEADIEITDNDKNEVIANIKSNSVTGKYLISLPAGKNYGIAIKSQGYLFHSENFNIADSAAYIEINKNIIVQKFDVGNRITLKNVFYDYGTSTLKPESISELNQLVKLMNSNSDIKIEIASYTDSEGTEKYNLTLSQARSQAVLDFLFSAGISKEQVVAKGYGEANPIASNDTEEGRKLNRRTEIKILNK
ncbi:MAG: OmpA family protein [Bacteroidota bacterium]